MKKLLVMMIFMVGACSISVEQEFINQVAGKGVTIGAFYDDGDFDDDVYGLFKIYEVIDSNTAIYKSTEEQNVIYLKFEIKDGKIYVSDYNCTTAEQAKNSTTTTDVSK